MRFKAKEWLVALALGMVLAGFLALAMTRIGRQAGGAAGNWLEGVIEEKNFVSQPPETQITIGRGGVTRQRVDGTCTFVVRTADAKVYTVWVDPRVYRGKRVGDRFRFPRPEGGRQQAE